MKLVSKIPVTSIWLLNVHVKVHTLEIIYTCFTQCTMVMNLNEYKNNAMTFYEHCPSKSSSLNILDWLFYQHSVYY